MNFEQLPGYLKPLIKSEEDIRYLMYLCDQHYAKHGNAWGHALPEPTIARDLELVRVRFRDRKTYQATAEQFGISRERARQIVQKYLCGLHHPKVIRTLREYKAVTKTGKIKAWNKRVAEITEITGD